MISFTRVIAASLFLLSLFALVYGFLLLHPELVGWCPANQSANCLSDNVSFGAGEPLFWGTRWLPFLFFALLFVRREVFSVWWKAALPFALVALYFIWSAPLFPELYVPDRTATTEFLVQAFVMMSAIVMTWKYWRIWREQKQRVQ